MDATNKTELVGFLKFGNNGKMRDTAEMLGLNRTQVVNFDLPAGYTCPAALLCQSYAHRVTGKLTRGKYSKFECYAAKIERIYPTSRAAHWHNFDLIRHIPNDYKSIASLIQSSIDSENCKRSKKNTTDSNGSTTPSSRWPSSCRAPATAPSSTPRIRTSPPSPRATSARRCRARGSPSSSSWAPRWSAAAAGFGGLLWFVAALQVSSKGESEE